MISIIVPNYNHSDFLEERIKSILDQTYQDFELLLLDDRSTDNSVDILKKYSDHPKVTHIVINDTNSGSPFKQWVLGIKMATYDYIWIAESDDSSESEFLGKVMSKFSEYPDLAAVYTNSKGLSQSGQTGNILNNTNLKSGKLKGESFISNWFLTCGL